MKLPIARNTPRNLRSVNCGIVRGIIRTANKEARSPIIPIAQNKTRIAANSPSTAGIHCIHRLPTASPRTHPKAPIWLRWLILRSHVPSPLFSMMISTVTDALATQKKLRSMLRTISCRNEFARETPKKHRPEAAYPRMMKGFRREAASESLPQTRLPNTPTRLTRLTSIPSDPTERPNTFATLRGMRTDDVPNTRLANPTAMYHRSISCHHDRSALTIANSL